MGHQNHSYLRQKRGIYYFTRRIPKDLFQHYSSERLYISLQTRNPKEATSKAHLVCCQGFSDWRGFFLTEALVQFLFEFRLQRIDVASVVSGVSVF